jgi:hypothetical protein
MLRTKDQFMAITIGLVLLAPHWSASYAERIRIMGRDKLGETVKRFQVRHPKAVCGRGVSEEMGTQKLINSVEADFDHCCLNDRESLKDISPFPILNPNGCAFHAIFSNHRLYGLSYVLDVRSVKTVLPTFEEFYGPPDRMFWDAGDPSKLTFFDWARGGTHLDVWLSQLGRGEDSIYPSGEPRLETVSVSLWDVDLLPSRK